MEATRLPCSVLYLASLRYRGRPGRVYVTAVTSGGRSSAALHRRYRVDYHITRHGLTRSTFSRRRENGFGHNLSDTDSLACWELSVRLMRPHYQSLRPAAIGRLNLQHQMHESTAAKISRFGRIRCTLTRLCSALLGVAADPVAGCHGRGSCMHVVS
jgi:hypothetical protein